jgi:hypothetical protein
MIVGDVAVQQLDLEPEVRNTRPHGTPLLGLECIEAEHEFSMCTE